MNMQTLGCAGCKSDGFWGSACEEGCSKQDTSCWGGSAQGTGHPAGFPNQRWSGCYLMRHGAEGTLTPSVLGAGGVGSNLQSEGHLPVLG